MPVGVERARSAKARIRSLLPKSAKVSGLGITQVGADYAVKVNLAEALLSGVSLPKTVEGVPVVVEVVGPITKRGSPA